MLRSLAPLSLPLLVVTAGLLSGVPLGGRHSAVEPSPPSAGTDPAWQALAASCRPGDILLFSVLHGDESQRESRYAIPIGYFGHAAIVLAAEGDDRLRVFHARGGALTAAGVRNDGIGSGSPADVVGPDVVCAGLAWNHVALYRVQSLSSAVAAGVVELAVCTRDGEDYNPLTGTVCSSVVRDAYRPWVNLDGLKDRGVFTPDAVAGAEHTVRVADWFRPVP